MLQVSASFIISLKESKSLPTVCVIAAVQGMALPSVSSDLPPEYSSSGPASMLTPDDIFQPATFRLAERFIHTADSSNSPALYEISVGIDGLRETHQRVMLERLDYKVREDVAGEPNITSRKKLIFTLSRPPDVTAPTFPYYLRSESRQTIGNLGIKKPTSTLTGKKHFGVWNIAPGPTPQSDFVQREQLFDVKQGKRKGTLYEWTLVSSGQLIATDSEKDGLHCLELVVAADRVTVDALVASWCLHLWQDIAQQHHKSKTFEDCK